MLNSLEQAAIEMLVAGDHPVLGALRKQLTTCNLVEREITGTGFIASLSVDRSAPPAPFRMRDVWIRDVEGDIAGLQHGAGFMLLVKDGYVDALEGYSYEEPWPASSTEFHLYYPGGDRDWAALSAAV